MQSLFTFQLQPQLLRIEPLPISRIPMAAQFLTSAPRCCMLSVGHDFNGLQCFTAKMSVYYTHHLAAVQKATTTEWLFPLPSVTPLSPHVLFLSQTFPGRFMVLQPFVIVHQASETLSLRNSFACISHCTMHTEDKSCLCRLIQSPQTPVKKTI